MQGCTFYKGPRPRCTEAIVPKTNLIIPIISPPTFFYITMTEKTLKKDFRVIIAGGGLAGLTLANALERAGIDYLLLEARAVIDPAVGASMGIMANGTRILDQLSCYDDIVNLTYGIKMAGNHRESGELISPRDNSAQLGLQRLVKFSQSYRGYQHLNFESSI